MIDNVPGHTFPVGPAPLIAATVLEVVLSVVLLVEGLATDEDLSIGKAHRQVLTADRAADIARVPVDVTGNGHIDIGVNLAQVVPGDMVTGAGYGLAGGAIIIVGLNSGEIDISTIRIGLGTGVGTASLIPG